MYRTFLLTSSLLCVFFAIDAQASTITFGSGVPGTVEFNSDTGINYATSAAPAWFTLPGPAVWESIQADSLAPAIPDGTVVDFDFIFDLRGPPGAASITVGVDDSGKVIVNGVIVADDLGSQQGLNCAAARPNCVTPLTLNIGAELVPRINDIQIVVEQDGGGPFGVYLSGAADYGTATAEPGTALLFGAGLAIAALRARLKAA